MVKIDLITGFLGSGKTTFIKKYAQYLIDKGENIGILENDFGAVNVDMMLLQELESDKCELEMVSSGYDADCHKRRFKTKLIAMAMCGYDRIIVEPSGIYDVDEFFDTLCEEPLDQWYTIDNVITLVNANLENNLSDNSKYLLASQVLVAGSIILSRINDIPQSKTLTTINTIKDAIKSCNSDRNIDDIIIYKQTDSLTYKDLERINSSGYNTANYNKLWSQDDGGFESMYFLNKNYTVNEFEEKINILMNNKDYGNIFRIKGFLHINPNDNDTTNKEWLQFNATKNETHIEPIKKGQEVIIVIGENLNKELLNKLFS